LSTNNSKAAVLWTGGKDSCLALFEAQKAGYTIAALVTFVPKERKFLAHPLEFLDHQSRALDIPHLLLQVDQPFRESYKEGISTLKNVWKIDTLVTGDIAEVGGSPNWIRECSEPSGMKVFTPLWGRDRLELLHQLLDSKFKILFSFVRKPLDQRWIGRTLDHQALEELRLLNQQRGLDPCGEQGEYHTLVYDGPPFKKQINILSYSVKVQESLQHIQIESLELATK
jgi:diphthine-ammonia ligase